MIYNLCLYLLAKWHVCTYCVYVFDLCTYTYMYIYMCVCISASHTHFYTVHNISFRVVHYTPNWNTLLPKLQACSTHQNEKQKAENHDLFLPTPTHLNQPDRQILRWQATDFNGTDSGPSADTVTLTLRHASTLLERKIQVSASWHPSEASIFACQESFHPRNTGLGGRFK